MACRLLGDRERRRRARWEQIRVSASDTLHLHVEDFGGVGTPLLLLHGFTGSSESWRHLAPRMQDRWHPIAIDLPGHGRSDSPADPARYRVERTVDDLLCVLDDLRLERPHLLGYSMGGRVALHLAHAAQERFASLTLESASPGILDPAERVTRVASDEALAQLLDRDGIEPFVDRWERVPLFASQASLPAEVRARVRAQRLRSDPHGLAGSLRGFGAGVPDPLQSRLGELRLPVQLIVGALDHKYVQVGREMAAAIPGAALEIVDGTGHTVHLERPEAFAATLRTFLERTESALRLA
jgi:2-succinyl-6-hydroxy-2,4-cyclohexadiene-1-carboxylate synthase